jgi:hypothetical protein
MPTTTPCHSDADADAMVDVHAIYCHVAALYNRGKGLNLQHGSKRKEGIGTRGSQQDDWYIQKPTRWIMPRT